MSDAVMWLIAVPAAWLISGWLYRALPKGPAPCCCRKPTCRRCR